MISEYKILILFIINEFRVYGVSLNNTPNDLPSRLHPRSLLTEVVTSASERPPHRREDSVEPQRSSVSSGNFLFSSLRHLILPCSLFSMTPSLLRPKPSVLRCTPSPAPPQASGKFLSFFFFSSLPLSFSLLSCFFFYYQCYGFFLLSEFCFLHFKK